MLCWALGPHTRRPPFPPGEEVEVSVVLQDVKSGLAQSTDSSSHEKCMEGFKQGEGGSVGGGGDVSKFSFGNATLATQD